MKFWPDEREKIEAERAKKFAGGSDATLFLHTGFFISSYALVELRISSILAKATGVTTLIGFDLLTRGMDLRVKIERLRAACEKGLPLGPNLDARLDVVNKTMRPIRNKIAHQNCVLNPDGKTISFATLAAMPDFFTHRHPDQTDPETIDCLDLFEYCGWLRLFNRDCRDVNRDAARNKMFEITNPLTPLGRGPDHPPAAPKPVSTMSRRERRRLRKGQKPRGKYRAG
jgi:hypothetical protein